MRRRLILATAVLCLVAPGLLHAAPWEFDPAHTGVHFKVRHLMISSVRGEFEKVSGKIVYDEADVTKSSADITIDTASINTRVAKRDEDLRSPDFLDVAKYPTIIFKSKRVDKAGDGTLKMTGDLTIQGVTKEVVLTVEGPTPAIKDPGAISAWAARRPRRSTGRISGCSGTRPWRPAAWWWETRWRSPSTWRSTRSRRDGITGPSAPRSGAEGLPPSPNEGPPPGHRRYRSLRRAIPGEGSLRNIASLRGKRLTAPPHCGYVW